MSAKQILRLCHHSVPAIKKKAFSFTCLSFYSYTFSARRSYGEVYKHKHIVTSLKIDHRLLHLHESTIARFSNVSLQRACNCPCPCRFSYSCRCVSSDSSNTDFSSDSMKKHTEHDDDEIKQTQITDPQLASLIKDIHEDFGDNSHKQHSETAAGEEHMMKASHNNQPERNVSAVDMNKKDTEFEYDYQVAEDIEEYDYIDESDILKQQVRPEKVLPISLKRGQTGVFDLHELITLLEHLGASNIVTIPVPPEANFCDDMVVASVKSKRHLQAINDEMLWVHKRKKAKTDHHLVIEGLNKSYWCAMDLGNIVLHLFFGDSREFYDIESLWLLGPDRDPKCQEKTADPYVLSAEDLFWMETEQAKDKVTDQGDSSTTNNAKQVDSTEENGQRS